MLEKEHSKETWESFIKIAYPWAETAKKREVGEWATRLAQEVNRGPLVVTAQRDSSYKSRLKARIVEKDNLSPLAAAAISRLSKKLIPTIPLKR
jgi:hypothetical protein